ncbi:MAG: iron-containing alcohol dehydrogenase [Bacteroidetes bacterium]|nr:iron-containing alcohol dehydrogenase [Bacteroidota bacterium]
MQFKYGNTTQLDAWLRENLPRFSNGIVLSDENTSKYCLSLLQPNLKTLVLTQGEATKNFESLIRVIECCIENNMNRNSIIVNIGGGVICDLGGFAASIFQRGISYINIPTSLMAMSDAGFGGKNGINLGELKNYVGTFTHPDSVFINPEFLRTLSETELLSGYAEMIKHGLIAETEYYHSLIQKHPGTIKSTSEWEALIKKSVAIKTSFTQEDFREKGNRMALNFGHTFGHAIESMLIRRGDYIAHGYAVAAGLICEAFLSFSQHKLGESDFIELVNYVLKTFGKLPIIEKDIPELIELIRKDKKHKNDITFPLLNGIGDFILVTGLSDQQITDSLKYYCNAGNNQA